MANVRRRYQGRCRLISLPDDLMPGDYATYMQAVVLVTVLAAFFDATISFPDRSEVRFVTEGINDLWTA
jgi:hypothetical protein